MYAGDKGLKQRVRLLNIHLNNPRCLEYTMYMVIYHTDYVTGIICLVETTFEFTILQNHTYYFEAN